MRASELLKALYEGQFDERLRTVYGARPLGALYGRVTSVVEGFCSRFDPSGERELAVFSAPGRTELGGNHTDHQGGCAVCAAIDRDTLACAAKSEGDAIRVLSRGHSIAAISLRELAVNEAERSRSVALLRGVAARVAELTGAVGGFDAYTETEVLRGSGMSSSAAFEVLLGTVFNDFYCGGALTPVQLAQIGQYAENVYYGKPCGLLDQLGCALGGVIGADLADADAPRLRTGTVDLAASGCALVIIDSGANHSDLDDAFAAIPREMGEIARALGGTRLCEVDEAAFVARRDALAAQYGERAALRAEHYFAETKRARDEFDALLRGDFARALALIRESGASSREKLQNVSVDRPGGDVLLRAIERAEALAGEGGAARVHGGGFAGTAQAFVPREKLEAFIAGMEELLFSGCCHVVQLRAAGSLRLLP